MGRGGDSPPRRAGGRGGVGGAARGHGRSGLTRPLTAERRLASDGQEGGSGRRRSMRASPAERVAAARAAPWRRPVHLVWQQPRRGSGSVHNKKKKKGGGGASGGAGPRPPPTATNHPRHHHHHNHYHHQPTTTPPCLRPLLARRSASTVHRQRMTVFFWVFFCFESTRRPRRRLPDGAARQPAGWSVGRPVGRRGSGTHRLLLPALAGWPPRLGVRSRGPQTPPPPPPVAREATAEGGGQQGRQRTPRRRGGGGGRAGGRAGWLAGWPAGGRAAARLGRGCALVAPRVCGGHAAVATPPPPWAVSHPPTCPACRPTPPPPCLAAPTAPGGGRGFVVMAGRWRGSSGGGKMDATEHPTQHQYDGRRTGEGGAGGRAGGRGGCRDGEHVNCRLHRAGVHHVGYLDLSHVQSPLGRRAPFHVCACPIL